MVFVMQPQLTPGIFTRQHHTQANCVSKGRVGQSNVSLWIFFFFFLILK